MSMDIRKWNIAGLDNELEGFKLCTPSTNADHDQDGAQEYLATVYSAQTVAVIAAMIKVSARAQMVLEVENKKWPSYIRQEFAALRKALSELSEATA